MTELYTVSSRDWYNALLHRDNNINNDIVSTNSSSSSIPTRTRTLTPTSTTNNSYIFNNGDNTYSSTTLLSKINSKKLTTTKTIKDKKDITKISYFDLHNKNNNNNKSNTHVLDSIIQREALLDWKTPMKKDNGKKIIIDNHEMQLIKRSLKILEHNKLLLQDQDQDQDNKNKNKSNSNSNSNGTKSNPLNIHEGTYIEARYKKRNRYFKGRIEQVNLSTGTYDIYYDDNTKEYDVSAEYIRIIDENLLNHFIPMGSQIEARYHGYNRYYNGKIIGIHDNGNTYDIEYDDDYEIEKRVPYHLIKTKKNLVEWKAGILMNHDKTSKEMQYLNKKKKVMNAIEFGQRDRKGEKTKPTTMLSNNCTKNHNIRRINSITTIKNKSNEKTTCTWKMSKYINGKKNYFKCCNKCVKPAENEVEYQFIFGSPSLIDTTNKKEEEEEEEEEEEDGHNNNTTINIDINNDIDNSITSSHSHDETILQRASTTCKYHLTYCIGTNHHSERRHKIKQPNEYGLCTRCYVVKMKHKPFLIYPWEVPGTKKYDLNYY